MYKRQVSRESVPEIIREHKEKGYFMENILRIYDVFKEFFGEERVDLRIVEPPIDAFTRQLSEESIKMCIRDRGKTFSCRIRR